MRLRSGASFLEPPPPPSPFLQLPGPALQAVLQHLSTRDVTSAARACSQLRAAAATALDSIEAASANPTRLHSLLLYLERHGQHVSSLDVDLAYPAHLTRLPASCSRLRALSLGWGRVQLGASDSQPGVLQTASALTSLRIERSTMADSAQGVAAAVARLTRLQRLELTYDVADDGVLPGSMLAPLTALTHLKLYTFGVCLQPATLEHLSRLHGLRELQLAGYTLGPALTAVQHLHRLTALALSWVSAPTLTGLSSGLQRLVLDSCSGLGPQALAACTQLRELVLDSSPVAGGPEGTAALLAHLQQCTQLTHLQLTRDTLCEQPAAAHMYAALTASSSLEVLQLSELPAAAWQAMFGGSKRLPRLRELNLRFNTAGVRPADLAGLVRCCPALQRLHLYGLQGLHTADLQPLTALTGLAWLRGHDSSGADLHIELQTPEGQPPDVAAQLQQRIQQHAV